MLGGAERHFRPIEELQRGSEKVPVVGDGGLNQGGEAGTGSPNSVIAKAIHMPWHRTRPWGRELQWVSLSLRGR